MYTMEFATDILSNSSDTVQHICYYSIDWGKQLGKKVEDFEHFMKIFGECKFHYVSLNYNLMFVIYENDGLCDNETEIHIATSRKCQKLDKNLYLFAFFIEKLIKNNQKKTKTVIKVLTKNRKLVKIIKRLGYNVIYDYGDYVHLTKDINKGD